MSLYYVYMSMTATIRVPVKTRDQFTELARQQGSSVSKYLADVAQREHRAAIIAAAREEARDFENNPEAQAEFELWEGTLEDGID